jgi:hypothetical protein
MCGEPRVILRIECIIVKFDFYIAKLRNIRSLCVKLYLLELAPTNLILGPPVDHASCALGAVVDPFDGALRRNTDKRLAVPWIGRETGEI